MIKREFFVIKEENTIQYIIMGFNGKYEYGEVFIRDKSSKTYAFRGYNRQETLKEAKKQMNSFT